MNEHCYCCRYASEIDLCLVHVSNIWERIESVNIHFCYQFLLICGAASGRRIVMNRGCFLVKMTEARLLSIDKGGLYLQFSFAVYSSLQSSLLSTLVDDILPRLFLFFFNRLFYLCFSINLFPSVISSNAHDPKRF